MLKGTEQVVRWAFESMSQTYYEDDVMKEKDKNFLVNMVLDMPLSRIPLNTQGKITAKMIEDVLSQSN